MEILDLQKVGLTNGEIKLYSALLDLGESTRTKLAQKSGISPSKIYDVANRLLEKGIISAVKINGVIHFNAATPEKLKDFLDTKEQEINKEKEIINELLPTLISKYSASRADSEVEVFYGWEGMKTIYNDLLKTMKDQDTNYVFGAGSGKNSRQSDIFFSQYYLKRKKAKFATKIIFNESLRNKVSHNSFLKQKKNETKFLDQETFAEIDIHLNYVSIIMLLEKPMIIRIKNQEAANSFKHYFDSLWKIAKK